MKQLSPETIVAFFNNVDDVDSNIDVNDTEQNCSLHGSFYGVFCNRCVKTALIAIDAGYYTLQSFKEIID